MIVTIGVRNQGTDAVQQLHMLEQIQTNNGQLPAALTADTDSCSTDELQACDQRGFAGYISTSRQIRPGVKAIRGTAAKEPQCKRPDEAQAPNKASQTIYALRKTVVETIVEPVFGHCQGSRGLNRFRLRRLEQGNKEWALMATT